MKTILKTSLLQSLLRPFRSLSGNRKISSIENYSASEFMDKYKTMNSIFACTLYISDTDCDHQLVDETLVESYISKLKLLITKSLGGLTVQYGHGFYQTLDGNIITENVSLLSMYVFDNPIKDMESIFQTFFEYAMNSRQESVLVTLNNKAMIIYI